MFRILFLILAPILILAESVSYGEDPFLLGVSIDALALGNIKALPMANPSPGGNVASLNDRPLEVSFQHTEGFGGVYQTDVFTFQRDKWSVLVFRGGVSGIPDTRDALLDFGSDGLANTNDSDGTEDNGVMDPGERLQINSISYFSTQQLLLEVGYSHSLREDLAVHGTARLLHHDLYAEQGQGIGFHAGLLWKPLDETRIGFEITDALTTTMFWSTGSSESYLPIIHIAADHHFRSKRVPFHLRPIVQIQIPVGDEVGLNRDEWGMSGGLEIGFQDQLFIQLGRTELSQFQVGAMIRTRYLDLHYGTGFSDLTSQSGQTHRLGVDLRLASLDLF